MMQAGVLLIVLLALAGCSRDFNTVDRVELENFMGDWYVIAILPNPIEKNAVNGIESYALNKDGTIAVTYKFRKGTPSGKEKIMRPKAKVYNKVTNAEWRIQLFKPFWSKYLIVYLDENYLHTAIGVPNRKFVWIMSRSPEIPRDQYARILDVLAKEGYNTDKIVRMPQKW
jgi:apolipoprotein D and lipocalin family protein